MVLGSRQGPAERSAASAEDACVGLWSSLCEDTRSSPLSHLSPGRLSPQGKRCLVGAGVPCTPSVLMALVPTGPAWCLTEGPALPELSPEHLWAPRPGPPGLGRSQFCHRSPGPQTRALHDTHPNWPETAPG